ncbi:hypothetical protein [Cerasicoccus frondis]|uniref:hypothetical protein n=1 Tax=Cerasicoccus frondis TaxID=490090 RepID=UPI002852519A|nr:hypothetical protein [Cerasicoccus frondis]
MRTLLITLLLFLSLPAIAIPPAHRKHPPTMPTESRLVGHWHSTSLSGDAIGLAVDNIVVEFRADKRFKATANLNIGGPSTFQGKYAAKRQKLTLQTESNGDIDCVVTFHGPRKLTLNAPAKGVTAEFTRGSAPSSSGSWF